MRKLTLIVLLLGAAPKLLFAQGPATLTTTTPGSSQTIDDIRQAYRIHAGPFYVNPTVLLKELGVDTNVFNQSDQPQSDFTFTLTPQADVAVPFARRGLLRTTVGTDLVYYRKFSSERSIDPQFTVRAEGYANRITLFAQESYLNTRQRPNYEIDLRSRHLENDLGAGAIVRVTPKVSVEVAGQHGETRFDADAFFLGSSLRETLNRNSTGFSVTARDRWTPLTTFGVRYEKLHDAFPFSPQRDTDSFRVMPGVEFKPKALINGSAYIGYRRFTPTNSALPGYDGLVSNVALSYTLLGATSFGVTYDRDVNYSVDLFSPYFVDNSPGMFIRRQLRGRFDLLANAAFHRYTYRTIGAQPLEPRSDTTKNYGANVGYRMRKQTRVGFGLSYWTRDSNTLAFRQYDGLTFGTTVTYGFQ